MPPYFTEYVPIFFEDCRTPQEKIKQRINRIVEKLDDIGIILPESSGAQWIYDKLAPALTPEQLGDDVIRRIKELEDAVTFIYEILRPGLCPQSAKACESCDFEVKQALHRCAEVLGICE